MDLASGISTIYNRGFYIHGVPMYQLWNFEHPFPLCALTLIAIACNAI